MTRCSKHEACHGGDFEPANAAKHFERLLIPAIGEVLPDGLANHVQLAIAPGIINAGSLARYLGGIALRKHGSDGACRSGVSNAHFSGDDKVHSSIMSFLSEQDSDLKCSAHFFIGHGRLFQEVPAASSHLHCAQSSALAEFCIYARIDNGQVHPMLTSEHIDCCTSA